MLQMTERCFREVTRSENVKAIDFTFFLVFVLSLFHVGGANHIEISPLTCSTNQWGSFYMIGTSPPL